MYTPLDLKTQVLNSSKPGLKIGVVADTYNNHDGLRLLLDRFLVGGARWLFVCGGLGSIEMVDLLKPWQVYVVRGEREANWQAIENALRKARLQSSLPTEFTITLEGKRIAMCYGDVMSIVTRWTKSGNFDYIFHGHSLRRRVEKIGMTRIIVPGALGGPRYHNRSGCLIDLGSDEVKFIEIEN